jgi:Fe-S oxidoreductase
MPIDLARGLETFRARLQEADAAHLDACVHCGLCAGSCHYYRAEPSLENVPARKLDLIAQVYRRYETVLGRLGLQGSPLDDSMAKAWLDAVYGRCTLCGRCSLNCTVGINLPRVFKAARAAVTAMGLTPPDLQATVDNSLRHGNNMAITREDWVETVDWLQDELRQETGDPLAELPMDRKGAKILFTVNPREPKFFPLSLQASAKVFWAAKEDWTLASDGWDLTNYGLFTCDDKEAGAITQNLVEAMARLGCETLVIGECGHGYASARWEGPEWLQGTFPFKVRSFLEVMDEYLEQGRIHVDPALNQLPATLHDPCNLVRHGGVAGPQRRILAKAVASFTEMTPNRAENFCCGGGGGQLAMGAFKERRMRSGSVKAAQIKDSGARVVVAPCHNCVDQLSELNKFYKLNVKIKTVAEMVADALVNEPTGEK